MATKINLSDATRGLVLRIIGAQREKGAVVKWSQKEHDAAVAYAAAETAAHAATTEPSLTERELAKWFLETYAGNGFPSNASQFSQALDKLPEDDECYVKRSTAETSDYI